MYADDYFAVLRWIHRGRQNAIVLRGLWTEYDLITSNLHVLYLIFTSPPTGFILLLPDFHTKIAFVVTKYIHLSGPSILSYVSSDMKEPEPAGAVFPDTIEGMGSSHPGRRATCLFDFSNH